MPFQPIWPIFEVNGLDWHCCLTGSSKMATRILIFSIAMVTDYLFDVKNIDILAPAFFKHNNSFIATSEGIAHQFLGMMTAFTNASDPELLYSHCWQVKTRIFNLVKNHIFFFGVSLILKLSFSTKDPPKKPIHDRYYFFWGDFSTKIEF
jgi:hypothetical protein